MTTAEWIRRRLATKNNSNNVNELILRASVEVRLLLLCGHMLSLLWFSTIFSDNLVVRVKVKEFLKLATHQTFVQLGPKIYYENNN